MFRNLMKSTSILALALGTTMPTLTAAQTDCADGSEPPCMETPIEDAVSGVTENLDDAASELEQAVDAETQSILEEATGEAEAEAQASEDDVAAEAEVAVEGEANGDGDGSMTEEVAAETDAQADGDMTTEAEAATEVEAETESEVEADATAEADADAAAESDADMATGDAATSDTGAETAAEADVTTDSDSTAETGSMDGADAEATAETDTEMSVETDAEATAESETDAEAEPMAEAEPEPELPEMNAQDQIDALQAELDKLKSSAAAAADSEGEVTTETVTEETSRSSDEEFETTASGDATASAKSDDDDKGLSNFEKVALAGLGALVVGKVLDNGSEVVSNSGDRVVVERDGQYYVLKDDDALLRQPGNEVSTENFSDGSSRVTVNRPDGARVITVRASDGTVLRRTKVLADGTEVVLFDDTQIAGAVEVDDLNEPERTGTTYRDMDAEQLRAALAQQEPSTDRRFSLAQIRAVDVVRKQVPVIAVDNINFRTGSAVIQSAEAEELAALGRAMRDAIDRNPREIFLIEGHTDAVGGAGYNLALSDRRAESLALALSEYFEVPPENMVVQGYGESDLLIPTQTDERANRRAAVRRITGLIQRGS